MVYFTAEDFNHVKAQGVFLFEVLQIVFRGAPVTGGSAGADGFGRCAVKSARAGFNFTKYQHIARLCHNVHFRKRSFKVPAQNFAALAFKVFRSRLFAFLAQLFVVLAAP